MLLRLGRWSVHWTLTVLGLNYTDEGTRKFILVQLPEKTEDKDFKTIADICRERVRRVIKRLDDDEKKKLNDQDAIPADRGFRAFKLSNSNFKIWNGQQAPKEPTELAKELRLFSDHIHGKRSQEDMLFELILKSGLPLTANVIKRKVSGKSVYSIADGLLVIVLENPISQELLRAVVELAPTPQRVVCLDPAFQGNDQLKTNTVLEMRSHGIEFRTV